MLACMPACIAGHMSVVMYVYVDGTLLALELISHVRTEICKRVCKYVDICMHA